ncbi:MAG TPA: type II toxin-antitoxin system VapC family toxin [Allosphingosinicella sp.]|jgi:tRNA(fMet)-specific endonuclease VapC
MRYLLDTNILIHSMARDGAGLRRRIRIHDGEVALSAVVLHELYFGAFRSDARRDQLDRIERLSMEMLSFDRDDARAAGLIRADLKRKGTPIGPYDLLIAGQARARGLTVVTRNVGEFQRVEGLAVEAWAG